MAMGIPEQHLIIGMAMKTQPITLPSGQLSYVFNKA
jgi:hypothetical protein